MYDVQVLTQLSSSKNAHALDNRMKGPGSLMSHFEDYFRSAEVNVR